MITIDNLKQVLTKLEFKKEGDVYSKHYPQHNCVLAVDFVQKRIIYPTDKGLVIFESQTTNFDKNENFVVLECVHQLLDKGYHPEHLILEPKWQVGHDGSGGRADILVKNQEGIPFLIIECKTAGKEFDKAWADMQNQVTQLFTYVEQEKSTQFICLYASDYDNQNDTITREQRIVTVKDDDKTLALNKKLPSFRKANNVKERFETWKKTYGGHFETQGIFEDDIITYEVGKKKYRIEDLVRIEEKDIQKKYHEFATILRKYNVSGRENAFDKLVNLFLAKIVDEKYNAHDLQFRWFGITADNYFKFIDRLEKLYANGMKEHLKEDVTYVAQQDVLDAFHYFKHDPMATRDTVLEHFKKQKYFTNNDFSFIDVHNEKLFFQNFEILRRIVQMIENIQLNGDQQNQFLGDLFEGFLDRGVKQSEGQFFTPMPIVKFILMSLPLQHLLKDNTKIPKAIDYACGAGHFLTELAAQIKEIVQKDNPKANLDPYFQQLHGIEKEYRLSKVAKVSAFMYGQKEVNIIYADALTPHDDIKNETYSLIVANPPFAVKGFLETLDEEQKNAYSLTKQVNDFSVNNAIQCFFLERAQQLLEVGGVTGIIVPSSILSNGDTIHIATREMLLKYFDFVALAELGGRTFGETGTNTVVLFLRKKTSNTAAHQHYKERVDKWFSTTPQYQNIFADQHLLERYCQHTHIEFDHYKRLLTAVDDVQLIAPLLEYEIFKDYQANFKKTADKIRETQAKEIVRKEKQWTSAFKKEQSKVTEAEIEAHIATLMQKLKAEHSKDLDRAFINFLKDIEKDKVYYFVLALSNPQKVLIVKSPAANAEQKKFLGYTWSKAKGNEGIKYLATAATVVAATEKEEDDEETKEDKRVLQNLNAKRYINTPLFDANNPLNDQKINYFIQQNFLGQLLSIPEHLQPFLSMANLTDMLDFSRKEFNKVIVLTQKKDSTFETKHPLVRLEDISKELFAGGDAPKSNYSKERTSTYSIPIYANGIENKGLYGFTDKPTVTNHCVTISARGTLGYTELRTEPFVPIVRLIVLVPNNKIDLYYLKAILNQVDFTDTGSVIPQLTIPKISGIKIPLPPPSIQEQIVKECEAIDTAVTVAENVVEDAKQAIEAQVNSIYNEGYAVKRLSEICTMQAGKFVSASDIEADYKAGLYPCYGGNGLRGYTKTFTHEGTYPLIGRQGALCGNVHRVTGTFHATEHAVVVTPNSDTDINWLFHQLQALKLNQYATGVAQPGLSVQKILTVTTPVPPPSKQTEIVSAIESLEKEIATAQKTITEAASVKAAILKKYL